jgi:N-acetylmuramoyl-L-alanine amidase
VLLSPHSDKTIGSANDKTREPSAAMMPQHARRLLAAFLAFAVLGAVAPARGADDQTLRLMALNLYHEAGAEGRRGMVAVGWVVLNRLKDPAFPKSVIDVITHGGAAPPCQWGWFCDGRPDTPRNVRLWRLAQQIARELLSDPPPDPTNGALWFQETFRDRQPWMRRAQLTARLGGHDFFGR